MERTRQEAGATVLGRKDGWLHPSWGGDPMRPFGGAMTPAGVPVRVAGASLPLLHSRLI